MKVYADPTPEDRLVLPVKDFFPSYPKVGEVIFFNQYPRQGIYVYTSDGWFPLYATENNIWENHVAQQEQRTFFLRHSYNTDGKSLNVYVDGVRLRKDQFAEVAANIVTIKLLDEYGEDIFLQYGQIVEFQIFNARVMKPFNVKEFLRRNGDDAHVG
ncbi:MAG: hypothetical protein QXN55_00530 [Candidatus Nitrosotenuis sp.]